MGAIGAGIHSGIKSIVKKIVIAIFVLILFSIIYSIAVSPLQPVKPTPVPEDGLSLGLYECTLDSISPNPFYLTDYDAFLFTNKINVSGYEFIMSTKATAKIRANCRQGSNVGENKNYWYCYQDPRAATTKWYNRHIYEEAPDGTILMDKLHYLHIDAVLDSTNNNSLVKVSCDFRDK